MSEKKEEFSGLSVNYYKLEIPDPANLPAPYTCECEDIIEALGMTSSEANQFKAIWRSCAKRELGLGKKGQDEHGVYDAEKMAYYGARTLKIRQRKAARAAG